MSHALKVPGIVHLVFVIGTLGAIGMAVGGIAAITSVDGIGSVLGGSLLGAAAALLVMVWLFTAIYQSIRDHGLYLGARLDLLAQQNNAQLAAGRARSVDAQQLDALTAALARRLRAPSDTSDLHAPTPSTVAVVEDDRAGVAPTPPEPSDRTRHMECPRCLGVTLVKRDDPVACGHCGYS